MSMQFLSKLSLLASVPGGPERGFLDELARRWEAGQWGMYPIALCLIIALAIIIERTIVLYFSATINKDAFIRGLKKHIYAGDLDKAINYVAGQKATPLTNVIKAGLMNVPKGEEEVQAALDEATLRETPRIEARSGYLAMLGNAAMLAGLLGTVSGLINCFEAVANVNPADKATILAAGISEAMNCTGFGLLTAIPALVAFSVLMGRTQHIINDINETSVSVLNLVPFIDLMAVTISFLIMTAVWDQIGRLQVSQAGGPSDPTEEVEEKKTIPLTLLITDKDLKLTAGGTAYDPMPLVRTSSGKLDLVKLLEKLKEIKTQIPDQTTITLQTEDSVRYEDLVMIIDECIGSGLPQVSVSAAMG